MLNVAFSAIFNKKGELLLGLNRESQAWKTIGGKMDPGEKPVLCAYRECFEECGLIPTAITYLGSIDIPKAGGETVRLHGFQMEADGTPTNVNDPDNEFESFKWVDISAGLPKEIADNLEFEFDVILRFLLLQSGIVNKEFGVSIPDVKATPRTKDLDKSEDLNKVQPTPKFPKLGLANDKRDTPYVTTQPELETKHKLSIFTNVNHPKNKDLPRKSAIKQMKAYADKAIQSGNFPRGQRSNAETGISMGYARAGDVGPDVPYGDTTLGTKLHEDLHGMFGQVHTKYGKEARTNLANNLYHAIPPQYRSSVDAFQDYYNPPGTHRPEMESEEKLARLINYMNSGADRDKYHFDDTGTISHDNRDNSKHDKNMKRAYKALVAASGVANENWLKEQQPWVKSELEKGAAQRLFPFDPVKDSKELVNSGYVDKLKDWQFSVGSRPDSYALNGNAAHRAFHKLAGQTKVRLNDKTKQKEYLLHRGSYPQEISNNIQNGVVNHSESSSWTPDLNVANNFAHKRLGETVSAWVPEHKIQMVPKQYGNMGPVEISPDKTSPNGQNRYETEHEVIVGGGHNSQLAKPEEIQSISQPLSTLDGRINQAGKEQQRLKNQKSLQRKNIIRTRLKGRDANKSELEKVEVAPKLHDTVEGFLGAVKGVPKGPERSKFVTQHANHAPLISALNSHPQGPAIKAVINTHLNSRTNAGFKPGQAKAIVKSESRIPKGRKLQKKLLDTSAGYNFQHEHQEVPGIGKITKIHAFSPNKEHVGTATFAHTDKGLTPGSVVVDEDHQRKGIASHMYGLAEKATGKKITPSSNQTPEGQALWSGNAQNKQFGKNEELVKMGAMNRLAPFNPVKDKLPKKDAMKLEAWQQKNLPEMRIAPPMHPNAHKRALHKLSGSTKVQQNPFTGEKEYLLHRGVGEEEYDKATSPSSITHADVKTGAESPSDFVNHSELTSWTPKYGIAKEFAKDYAVSNNTNTYPRVLSAWVPESAIGMVPNQYGSMSPSHPDQNWMHKEHEVIVKPNHNSFLATPNDLDSVREPASTLDGRINEAAKDLHPAAPSAFKRQTLANRIRNNRTHKSSPLNKKEQPEGYELETEKIKENKKTAQAQKPHKFKRAKWTWPNAHPRCILCGFEESMDGKCPGTGNDLTKKLSDIQPGTKNKDHKGTDSYDYSHLLSPIMKKKGYNLRVYSEPWEVDPSQSAIKAVIRRPNLKTQEGPIGMGVATMHGPKLHIHDTNVSEKHRGKGLGTSLYEALLVHGHKVHGAQRAAGDEHSTMASAVHQKVAQKHGLNYTAAPNFGPDSGSYADKNSWQKAKTGAYDSKMGPYQYALKSESNDASVQDLNKGIKNIVSGALAAGMLASAPLATEPKQEPAKISHQKSSLPKKAKKITPWHDSGLTADLKSVAHLETSYGKNMKHARNSHGTYDTAVGAVGIKPRVAMEHYMRNKELQNLYPNLQDKTKFMSAMNEDPIFYNTVASSKWNHLLQILKSPERAAYAWRWGADATKKATPETIANDGYVKRFKELQTNQATAKR